MPVTQEQAAAFGKQQLAAPVPQNGIVILFRDDCTHCQHTLESTNMATKTSNGTPVKWIDVASPEGQQLFPTIPGLKIANGAVSIGGTDLTGVPAIISMKDGAAAAILKQGALEPGELDMLNAQRLTQQPAKGGNTVPKVNNAETATSVQR